jgi:hypothetical protein
MNQSSGVNSLRFQEAVFRRLPETWKDLPRVAFLPHETADTDGLSLSREIIGAQGTAETGASGKSYYVAESTVGAIEGIPGLTVFADTDTHAVIPELNSQLRQSKIAADKNRRDEWARLLQLLFKNKPVVGPYQGKS